VTGSFTFEAVYKKEATITSTKKAKEIITNSDEKVCPTEWEIVNDDKSAFTSTAA